MLLQRRKGRGAIQESSDGRKSGGMDGRKKRKSVRWGKSQLENVVKIAEKLTRWPSLPFSPFRPTCSFLASFPSPSLNLPTRLCMSRPTHVVCGHAPERLAPNSNEKRTRGRGGEEERRRREKGRGREVMVRSCSCFAVLFLSVSLDWK